MPRASQHTHIGPQADQELPPGTRAILSERILLQELRSRNRLGNVLQHEKRAADEGITMDQQRTFAFQLQLACGVMRKAGRKLLQAGGIEPTADEHRLLLRQRDQRLQEVGVGLPMEQLEPRAHVRSSSLIRDESWVRPLAQVSFVAGLA